MVVAENVVIFVLESPSECTILTERFPYPGYNVENEGTRGEIRESVLVPDRFTHATCVSQVSMFLFNTMFFLRALSSSRVSCGCLSEQSEGRSRTWKTVDNIWKLV